VLVEDGRQEEEDGVTKEPQEASLRKTQGGCDHLETRGGGGGYWCVCGCHLGEAEVEVSLQGAPLGGDDLVEHRGQQQGQAHFQGYEQEAGQTLLGVVAVMLTL